MDITSPSFRPALGLVAALAACGGGDECPPGENRICDGVDNCLCGPPCVEDSDCLGNQSCAENIADERACVSISWRSGNAPECPAGERATEALCGGDSCSCAAPCSTHEECRSLCCVEGVCALPCVCDSPQTIEVITCGGS